MTSYSYYPGCSYESTANPYEISATAISKALGLQLQPLEDWNCCGATESITLSKATAFALVGRNLALAARESENAQLVAPCSACYANLKKVDHYMGKYSEINQMTNEALAAGDLSYDPGTLRIRHLIEVLYQDVGLEALSARVVRPLHGLRLAPYYGCYLVRPQFGADRVDDPMYPTILDELLTTAGATVTDFGLKTECCGGHLTQIDAEASYEIIRRLLQNADESGADAIVTMCPMCQLNLDAYQQNVNSTFKTRYRIPVLFFTQVLGLALGFSADELAVNKGIISANVMLAKLAAAQAA